jgi:hypothetical protein
MNHRSRLRLHLKVLTTPNVSIDTMVRSMREVYGSVGVRVDHVSTETFDLAANPALQLLNTVDIGRCGGNHAGAARPVREPKQRRHERRDRVLRAGHQPSDERLRRAPRRSAQRRRHSRCDPMDAGPRGRSRTRPYPRRRQRPPHDRQRHRQHHESAA